MSQITPILAQQGSSSTFVSSEKPSTSTPSVSTDTPQTNMTPVPVPVMGQTPPTGTLPTTGSVPQQPAATAGSPAEPDESKKNPMVTKVAEIFHCAGFAFKKLGELVQHLDDDGKGDQQQSHETHWQPDDIEQFHSIVKNFSEEITTLSNSLKNRMTSQLKEEHLNNVTKTLPAADKSLLVKAEQNSSVVKI